MQEIKHLIPNWCSIVCRIGIFFFFLRDYLVWNLFSNGVALKVFEQHMKSLAVYREKKECHLYAEMWVFLLIFRMSFFFFTSNKMLLKY